MQEERCSCQKQNNILTTVKYLECSPAFPVHHKAFSVATTITVFVLIQLPAFFQSHDKVLGNFITINMDHEVHLQLLRYSWRFTFYCYTCNFLLAPKSDMEAYFCHKIKINGNCAFLSHKYNFLSQFWLYLTIQTFFLIVVSLRLAILLFSQNWDSTQNLPENYDKLVCTNKLKRSHNCEFISHSFSVGSNALQK